MKKIISLLLCIILMMPAVVLADTTNDVSNTLELWAPLPETTAYTRYETMIFKAMDMGMLSLYSLPSLGGNYYLAACEHQMDDGGYNGKSDTAYIYYYTILATDEGFIVIDKAEASNEYYWERDLDIRDMSEVIDSSYYDGISSDVPRYIFSPTGKYTSSYYDEYFEYFIITKGGKIYTQIENSSSVPIGDLYIKDGKIYIGHKKYKSGSSYRDYYLSDGSTIATYMERLSFKEGTISYEEGTKVAQSEVTAANGYKFLWKGFGKEVYNDKYYKINDNLYLKFTQPFTYNAANDKWYYYKEFSIYQNVGGVMQCIKKQTIPTTSTRIESISPKKITGLDETAYTALPVYRFNDYFVLNDGTVCTLSLDTTIFKTYNLTLYNDKLATIRTKEGDSWIYEYASGSTTRYYWQRINYLNFNTDGSITLSESTDLKVGVSEGLDGYYSKRDEYVSGKNIKNASYSPIKEWFGRCPDNVFPDGRYAKADWKSISDTSHEVWYNIFDSKGNAIGIGSTGSVLSNTTVMDSPGLFVYTYNNSRFIVAVKSIENTWIQEFYRYSVTERDTSGEVITGGNLGEKIIAPPSDTDTQIAQPVINFANDTLPIGYNIKDGVVDSDKLKPDLRDAINAVRLNDIVIISDTGYDSGVQNSGSGLDSYSKSDYTFGDTFIRIYTNGQNFGWYCNDTELLSAGTYAKSYEIGEKTIYVTFKIIEPPSNDGATTVVF